MTYPSDQDEKLLQFLKEHAPEAPKAPAGEEIMILEKIERSNKTFWESVRSVFTSQPWLYPVAIAALLAAVIIPQQIGHAPSPVMESSEIEQMEEYLQTTLAGAFYDSNTEILEDWYTLLEPENGA